ncbi:ABC transporter ATP-binding protein [Sorangium cellulosum]|uniref:ABC transporter ATP-binding protein n=1 Tax=Sorangium cellulosum TaxID=56 RepID=A0A150SH95_SORCE|nr:ABC transporter ATP-binding protein [Sorangium cellulosum]
MKLVAFIAGYSRRILVLAVIAGVLCGACNTALLVLINQALQGERGAVMWAFAAVCLLLPFARYHSEILLTRLSQGALFDLRVKICRKILGAPLRQLEEIGPPRMLTVLTDDVPVITATLQHIPIICINLVIVVGGLLYLGWLSPVMLASVVALIVLGIVGYQLPMSRATRHFRRAREATDELMKTFRALTRGVKELKLHARRREAFLATSLDEEAGAVHASNLRGMVALTAANGWGQGMVFAIIGVTLFVLPLFQVASAETLVGYAIILLYLMTPMQVLIGSLPALSRAGIAVQKVEDLGAGLAVDAGEAEAPAPLPEKWKRLEFAGVTHAYRSEGKDDSFTLGPIHLTVRRGELIFLVGGNGSGKTTLAKLITGLYTPEAGEIRLDGEAITDKNRQAYRQLFSVVFFDFHLFERLIGLDSPELTRRARGYLSRLQLDHKVSVEGGALSTTSLSQGQRKRLALLTAYLEDRPIYLFDEWAADQDPVFKDVFYRQILAELRSSGKTIIVISHDEKYFGLADRVIKMDFGQLVGEAPAARSDETRASA